MAIVDRQMNRRLGYLERCAERAPEGTYQEASNATMALGAVMDDIRETFKEFGFSALGDDRARNLEVAIYAFLLESNPSAYGLLTGEGFGEHVDGPAGERVMAQAIRDRDAVGRLAAPVLFEKSR